MIQDRKIILVQTIDHCLGEKKGRQRQELEPYNTVSIGPSIFSSCCVAIHSIDDSNSDDDVVFEHELGSSTFTSGWMLLSSIDPTRAFVRG